MTKSWTRYHLEVNKEEEEPAKKVRRSSQCGRRIRSVMSEKLWRK